MGPTWFKLLLVVAVIVLLFGGGRISDLMGDVAKGIKRFKKELGEEGEAKADAPKPVGQARNGEAGRLDMERKD
jgi:sec-independent protein translocase protein TatA